MLIIAEQEEIFVRVRTDSEYFDAEWNDKIDSWTDYLSLQDFTQYNGFVTTPAGAFFVENTREITRISSSAIQASPYFFRPNLNQRFVLEIIEADGVVEFRDIFARRYFIRDLEAALDQSSSDF